MLKIRLARTGKRNAPSYRIVVTKAKSKRSSHLEIIGFYNPSHNPPILELDKDKLKHWIQNGAQKSTGVQRILDKK